MFRELSSTHPQLRQICLLPLLAVCPSVSTIRIRRPELPRQACPLELCGNNSPTFRRKLSPALLATYVSFCRTSHRLRKNTPAVTSHQVWKKRVAQNKPLSPICQHRLEKTIFHEDKT